ncbi:Membrane protein [Croceitalea dokdonensis DOKDO 023]|uniref:Membrane protein n=1 Tax=Croceitalea dokdonensis DOKDO 023 TaxID=1300341 RepID=A0A0P7AUZ5_9FLAO|nr:DUF2752 domain-containing protein [Croceitalea dokdonensis]KPM31709.1 Membrane protein [Croceitalea dokdonensis DOKDO 023]
MINNLLGLYLGIQDYMLPCLSKQLFGLDCPGCGLQRSLVFLAKGEFKAAFDMYPAIYAILALAFFLVFDMLVKPKNGYPIKIFLSVVTVGSIVLSYILKMNNYFN